MNKLPIIETPKYRTKVPSTQKTITYRPFTVREEKILMIAQEGADQQEIISAIRDVIKGCTFGKLDVSSLTMYDFEYIFLQLRAKSIGETAKVIFPCEHCKAENDVVIKFGEYEVIEPEKKISATYKINDDIGITLRQLRLSDAIDTKLDVNEADSLDALIQITIETIFDDEKIYKTSDYSKEDLGEFINGLPHQALIHIQEFVQNQPKVRSDITFTCSECQKINTIESEGILNFF